MRKSAVLIIGFFLVFGLTGQAQAVVAQPDEQVVCAGGDEKSNVSEATSLGSGMRGHIDPETGQVLTTTPPASQERSAVGPSRSTEGLIMEPAPGGGMMVVTRGRLLSTMAVKTKSDGSREAGCITVQDPTTDKRAGESVRDGGNQK